MQAASSLSDLRLIYYGKAGFGHISRIFSLNSQLFASKTCEICLKPVFPLLRSLKSDRLLGRQQNSGEKAICLSDVQHRIHSAERWTRFVIRYTAVAISRLPMILLKSRIRLLLLRKIAVRSPRSSQNEVLSASIVSLVSMAGSPTWHGGNFLG